MSVEPEKRGRDGSTSSETDWAVGRIPAGRRKSPSWGPAAVPASAAATDAGASGVAGTGARAQAEASIPSSAPRLRSRVMAPG
jgi:hypothetical protein